MNYGSQEKMKNGDAPKVVCVTVPSSPCLLDRIGGSVSEPLHLLQVPWPTDTVQPQRGRAALGTWSLL